MTARFVDGGFIDLGDLCKHGQQSCDDPTCCPCDRHTAARNQGGAP